MSAPFDGNYRTACQRDRAYMSAPVPSPSFPLTFFPNLSGTSLRVETHTLTTLKALVRSTVAASKRNLPLLSGCRFGDARSANGSLRHTANAIGFHAVVADCDTNEPRLIIDLARRNLIRANVAFLLFTTPSHHPDAARFRVICPLSKEYAPEDLVRFIEEINYLLGGTVAGESLVLSQGWFFGHLVADPNFEVYHHDA